MTWELSIGGVHLVNSNHTPTQGGDPTSAATTCFSVRQGWTPQPGEAGHSRLREEIPIAIWGSSQANTAARLLQLKRALRATPAVYRWQPEGAPEVSYSEVYSGDVSETPGGGDIGIGPAEGGYDLEGVIRLERAGAFGSLSLETLLSAQAVTNTHTGNLISLGALRGEYQDTPGQPLNITFAKPAAMAAVGLYLATAYSRSPVTLNEAKTATTLAGQTYTPSGNVDLSPIRTRPSLKLRIMARVKTLTNPTKGQLRVTVAAAGGAALWVGPFVQIGSNGTAQLLDLGGIDLSNLRTPLTNVSNVTLQGTLRSIDGTSVTATLDYMEVILYYGDFCKIESAAGLAATQRYQLFGAGNLAGGGWLPMRDELCQVASSADMPLAPAFSRPRLVKAFAGASLYVAWVDANNAHTNTDTSTITVLHAPLWSTLQA